MPFFTYFESGRPKNGDGWVSRGWVLGVYMIYTAFFLLLPWHKTRIWFLLVSSDLPTCESCNNSATLHGPFILREFLTQTNTCFVVVEVVGGMSSFFFALRWRRPWRPQFSTLTALSNTFLSGKSTEILTKLMISRDWYKDSKGFHTFPVKKRLVSRERSTPGIKTSIIW